MIDDIISDAEERMTKSLGALDDAFKRIRTGRAHPSILDSVMVAYYGSETPLNQLANVTVEEGRSLLVSPWEKNLIGDVEKAIMKSNLGLNPSNNGDTIRVPMPPLTEETRRNIRSRLSRSLKMPGLQYATSGAMPILILKISRRRKKFQKTSNGALKIGFRS